MSHPISAQACCLLVFLGMWAAYVVGFAVGRTGHGLSERNELLEAENEGLRAELWNQFGARARTVQRAVKEP